MSVPNVKTIEFIKKQWIPLAPYLKVPSTQVEYEKLLAIMNQLVDEIGNNEEHPLASLLYVVGNLIDMYEKSHFPELEELEE